MALSMGAPLPLNAVVQTQPSTSANAAPRHLDPRTSLAVLAAINVQMALTQSLSAASPRSCAGLPSMRCSP